MGRLVLYDALNNKIVLDLANADLQNIVAGSQASIPYTQGGCHVSATELNWSCGTYYEDFDMAYYSLLEAYQPFNMNYQIYDDIGGFSIVELVSRGYYTPGTSKTFFLNPQKTDSITIQTSAGSTDSFGSTVYSSFTMTVSINGDTKTFYNWSGSASMYNAGLAQATYNGVTGYYFFKLDQNESNSHRVRSAAFPIDYFGDLTPYFHELYEYYGGKPQDEIPISTDSGSIGGYSNMNKLHGDEIDLPTAPDETVSGVLATGFLNVYRPTDAQLRDFGGALWTNLFNTKWYDLDSVSNLILNSVSDPINFIVGLFMLPVQPAVSASDGINLGGIKVNTVQAPKLANQFVTVPFGELNIDELYGNYLDYAQSQLSIYLPYIGVADIDVQEVNGGSIKLEYIIDAVTGACVANVKCTKYTNTPWGVTYKNSTVHSYTGNVAIQLPISAGSFDTMLSGLINVGLGLGMNQPAKALQGMGEMITGAAGDVTTRGSLSSNTGKCCYQTPYLMFTRPIESRPANLGSMHGYSAGVGGLLGNFKGYVECTDIKLDGIVATTSEIDELRQICVSGIYI